MWFLEGDPSFAVMVAVSTVGYIGSTYIMWKIHIWFEALNK
jgi:hypothetical protein